MDITEQWMGHGTFKSYLIGYILSIVLTLAAYFTVTENILSNTPLIFTLMALAVAQFMVQLLFFIHLIKESQPRWSVLVFLFMTWIVLILVVGTLWIMYNLEINMTP